MNTKQLRYFLLAAQRGSIAAAARELDIAQPAISQQIANLERDLGVILFQRGFQGVKLTPAGELFIQYAQKIIDTYNHAQVQLQQMSEEQHSVVRIGMLSSIENVISTPLIEQINHRFNKIKIDINIGPSYSIQSLLQSQQIDLAVTYDSGIKDSYLTTTPLINEHMFLVVGKKFEGDYAAYLHNGAFPFWALNEIDILVPGSKDALGQFIQHYERITSIKLSKKRQYSGQLTTGLRQVMNTGGAMILPSSAIFHLEEMGLVSSFLIEQPVMQRKVVLATNNAVSLTPASIKVINVIKDVVENVNRAHQWRGRLMLTAN